MNEWLWFMLKPLNLFQLMCMVFGLVRDKSVFSGSHIKSQMFLIVLQYGWSLWKYRLNASFEVAAKLVLWIESFFESTNMIS